MGASDAVLLQRWTTRADAEAFAELVSRHSGMVYGTCRRILGDAAEAEDLAQECFLKLCQGGPREVSSLAGWLHRVATNRCLDRLREDKRRRVREATFAAELPVPEASWNEIQGYVDEALAALPDELRLPILHHFFEGHTHRETARMLGLTRSGVTRRIQRGVEDVRANLRRRGVQASGVALASLLATNGAEAAPATLTASLARMAVAGNAPAAAAAAASSLGAVKAGAIAVAVVAVLAAGTWGLLRHAPPVAPTSVTAEAVAPMPQTSIAPKPAPKVPLASAAAPAATVAPEEKPARTVKGVAVSPEGYPRPDVYFTTDWPFQVWHGTQAEANGEFTLENVALNQTHWYAFSHNTQTTALFTVPAEDEGPLRVVLDLGLAQAMGRVVDSAGAGVPKAQVQLRVTTPGGDAFLSATAAADSHGYYRFDFVPAGEGLTVEARVVPPGGEAPGPWTAPRALSRHTHGFELPEFVLSKETAANIAANQGLDSWQKSLMDNPDWERVGGTVQNSDGRPVVGAFVEVMFQSGCGVSNSHTDTDSAGRWSALVPADQSDLTLRVQHRDYVGTALDRTLKTPPLPRLRDRTAATILRRGLPLRGEVRDAAGNPVADALVLPHDMYGTTAGGPRTTDGAPREDEYSVRTGPDGSFALSCLPAGKTSLHLSHTGFAPKVLPLDMQPRMAPVDAVLDEGGTIRGRFVDRDGNPVTTAYLDSDEWVLDRQYNLTLHAKAGPDGSFELKNVPREGTFRFTIGVERSERGRFMLMGTEILKPREEPYEITLYPPPTFTGTVVDEETGRPVTAFHLRSGWYDETLGAMYWNRMGSEEDVTSEKGEFSLTVGGVIASYPPAMRFGVGISASGYYPAVTPLKRLDEPMEPVTVRLRRGVSWTGTVRGAGGRPLEGVQVAWIGPGHSAYVLNGQMDRDTTARPEVIVATGADGRFELPPSEEPATILALHASGYAVAKPGGFQNGGELTLTPWARVEGTVYGGNGPVPEALVEIKPEQEDGSVRWGLYTTAHVDGHYEVNFVPSMAFVAGRYQRGTVTGVLSNAVHFTTEPGATSYVDIGEGGQSASGRLALTGTDRPLDLTYAEVTATRADGGEQFAAALEPDGHFRFDGLPPGAYGLVADVYDPPVSPHEGISSLFATGQATFSVAEGAAAEIGDVRIGPYESVKAGDPMPDLRAPLLDGTEFALDSLRGRYALLEFWSVWKSPTREDVARMKGLAERYAGTGKVALVGYCHYFNRDALGKFVEERGIDWPLMYRGIKGAPDPIRRELGVLTRESLWLIGPDGVIIGRDLTLDEAEASLRQALGK